MFKCPHYYCIQWNYICDGRWDCPLGTDEAEEPHQCGQKRPCAMLFKCRKSHVCIHAAFVCDEKEDCPFGDDESLCLLHDVVCPVLCNCLTFVLSCSQTKVTQSSFTSLSVFRVLQFEYSSLISVECLTTPEMLSLTVKHTKMQRFCQLLQAESKVKVLSIQNCNVYQIDVDCFKGVSLVGMIKLSETNITHLSSCAFDNLTLLKYLNISHNPVCMIDQNAFVNIPQLALFSIVNISFDGVEILEIIAHFPLAYLETEKHQFCCQRQETAKCSTETPWYVSCSDLLINSGIKITCYTFSASILVMNILSIVLHRRSFGRDTEKGRCNSLQVVAVNAVDISCSIPLIVLWIEDLVYEGFYIVHEHSWKSSAACYVISALFLLFNFLSPFILGLLAQSRLSITRNPFESKFSETSFVLKVLSATFGTFLLIAIILTVVESVVNCYVLGAAIPLSVCSPFVDPQNQIVTIKVFTWTVIVFQHISVVFIIVIYIKLFVSLKKSQEKVKDCVSKQQSTTPLVVQIIIVTSSNIVCWIPCCVVYLLSMFLEQYPIRMMVWIIVAVNPINSLINPCVFVFTMCRKMAS